LRARTADVVILISFFFEVHAVISTRLRTRSPAAPVTCPCNAFRIST
jgi:hypothetical protein